MTAIECLKLFHTSNLNEMIQSGKIEAQTEESIITSRFK